MTRNIIVLLANFQSLKHIALLIHPVSDIIKESICSYKADYENTFKTIITFDCRGIEPTDFQPRVSIHLVMMMNSPTLDTK